MYKQLKKEEYSKFPFIRIPEKGENLTTFEGFQRLIMLDRYSLKDTMLETLKKGDLVLTTVKEDPKYPLMGYGTVKNIKNDVVTIHIDYPEYVSGVDLTNLEKPKGEITKPLEIYWEQIAYRVSKAIAEVEEPNKQEEVFEDFYWMLSNKYYIPGGRILYGAGNPADVTLFNCFSLGSIPDSRYGIIDHIKIAAEIMSRGGGVGSCISTLRPRDAVVKGVNGFSSGSVSWANYLSGLTHLISQAGSRRGAQMIGQHIWHPDILEFTMCKIQNPHLLDLLSNHTNPRISSIAEMYLIRDEGGNPVDVVDKEFMSGANISVLITDDFMEKVKAGEMWELKYPDLEKLSSVQKRLYDTAWLHMHGIEEWEKRGLPIKVYDIIPARDLWELINICARYSAEPGVIFIDRYNKEANSYYYENIDITNPCFTGDMKLLTSEGYKTFKDLDGKEVEIINYLGKVTKGKVWKTGEKETVRVKFWDNSFIDCTPDHRFMLVDGTECEAEDLRGKTVMPYLYHRVETEPEFVKLGFIQGDGNLGRLRGEYRHKGLEINFGKNDEEVRNYFGLIGTDRKEYVTDYTDMVLKLGFSLKSLPERLLPNTIDNWTKEQKRAFLKGMYTANGSVLKNGRVTYKTTCKKLAEQLESLLAEFNINSYITTNKPKKVKFNNGTYQCKESYDVNINSYRERIKFYNEIGFVQTHKMERLKDHLIENALKVRSVTPTGKVEEVYDFNEPETHWGVVNGAIVHNCGEQGLPKYGVCNLSAINLAKMVKDGKIDYELLEKVIRISQRFADNVIDISYYFIDENEEMSKKERRIGKGVMGLADLVIDLKLKYGSPEMIKLTEELFKFIATVSYDESINLAIEKGSFYYFDVDKFLDSGYMRKMPESIRDRIRENGIRNVTSLTVAPTGSTGSMISVSNGIEPYFAFKYYRSGRMGEFIEINTPIAQKYFEENPNARELPDYYVSAMDLTPEEHVLVQAAAQKWVDSSISKTVNAPTTFTVEDNKKLYELAYEKGLKGITVYVDGSRDTQVLNIKKEEQDELTSSTKLCKTEFDETTGNMVTEC